MRKINKVTHSLLPTNDLSHIQDLARYLADDAFGAEKGYYCGSTDEGGGRGGGEEC